MTKIESRALAYIKACYTGRNVAMVRDREFEVESAPDHYGKTYFHRVAYIGDMGEGKDWLVDVTGDEDRLMKYMG